MTVIVFTGMGRNRQQRSGTGARMDAQRSECLRAETSGTRFVDEAKLRVVIVEDSTIIRARLAEAVAEIPNVEIVGHAETEADAVSLLGRGDWDAAVLDLQLKQGTGLGVLKTVAQSARPDRTKIIVFTNYAFPQYRERSMLLGADYFFDKAREFHRISEVLAELAAGGPSAPH